MEYDPDNDIRIVVSTFDIDTMLLFQCNKNLTLLQFIKSDVIFKVKMDKFTFSLLTGPINNYNIKISELVDEDHDYLCLWANPDKILNYNLILNSVNLIRY